MPPPREWNLDATSRVGLRLSDYPSLPAGQARIEIARLIANKVPTVAGEYVSQNLVRRFIDDFNEAGMRVAVDGLVWVFAYVDGTPNTATIQKNQPVVFDMVTGCSVTGIDPDWSEEEYVIVGTAMEGYAGPGRKRIVIKLSPPPTPAGEGIRLAARPANATQDELHNWSKGVQPYWYNLVVINPTFQPNFPNVPIGFSTTGQPVTPVYTLRRSYLFPGIAVKIFKINGIDVTDFEMPPTGVGQLEEDLKLIASGSPSTLGAPATVVFGNGMGGKIQVYSAYDDPTMMLPKFTTVIVHYQGNRYVAGSANACGVPAPDPNEEENGNGNGNGGEEQ